MALFRGIIIIAGGDRKQTLAKVRHGYRSQVVQACFMKSPLRDKFQMFTMNKNHRLSAEYPDFATLLEKIGTGTYPTTPNSTDDIKLPDYLERCYTREALIDEIYGKTTKNL